MMNQTPQFDADRQPYFLMAGEVLAACVALAHQVEARRPDTAAIPGPLHFTLDGDQKTLLVSKVLGSDRVVVIERIIVDPRSGRFGASELPMAAPADGPAH